MQYANRYFKHWFMFRNYLSVAIRNLIRHKGYSIINIAGLAIGLASCMLIFLYITDELSYDRFNEKADRTYRINMKGMIGANEFSGTYTPAPMARALLEDYPEIEHVVRLMRAYDRVVTVEENSFIEKKILYADSSFFDVFSVKVLNGDANTALNAANMIVLTENTSRRYFGDAYPVGKTVQINGQNHMVTAVCENVPPNSHFRFDMLISMVTANFAHNPSWLSSNAQIYLTLSEGADPAELEEKFTGMMDKYIGPQLKEFLGATIEELAESGQYLGYFLQPLTDIHLRSNLDGEFEANSSIVYVWLFGAIAVFILLLACINFMNLTTARLSFRAKEVGLRKVMGSSRKQIIIRFLGESVLLALCGLMIALVISELLMPFFNELADKQMQIRYNKPWYFIPALIGFAFFTGIVAGSYPSFYLSRFQPVRVLKGNPSKSGKGSALRSILVLFQFTISIILLVATIIIYSQLNYIQDKNLGFGKEEVIYLTRANSISEQQSFAGKLKQYPPIKSLSFNNGLPGQGFGSNSHAVKGRPESEMYILMIMLTDYDYDETLGLTMTSGRFFDKNYSTDSAGIVLNEAAVRAMGLENPIGATVIRHSLPPEPNVEFKVIGVVKDFHFESLHQNIRPLAINLTHLDYRPHIVAVRFASAQTAETISIIGQTWKEFVPEQPLEYHFLDQELEKLYHNDVKTRKIYTIFSILAFFVASLGLLGLASFTAEQRSREIGIRKVYGATTSQIVSMLSLQFVKWTLLANIIAWPVSWMLMDNWLQNFAFRIQIGLMPFIVSAALAFIIAIATVIFQAYRAAITNPASTLKYE
jgi:putative ABC transport system permease protein